MSSASTSSQLDQGNVNGTYVCGLDELTPGTPALTEIDGIRVALVRVRTDADQDPVVYAINDRCSHANVSLSEGEVQVEGDVCDIECWLHGSRFDLRTGQPSGPPATEPVMTYPVEVSEGDVYVDVSADSDPA